MSNIESERQPLAGADVRESISNNNVSEVNNSEQSRDWLSLPGSLIDAVLVPLVGYSSANQETDPDKKYHKAKHPIKKNWQKTKGMTLEEARGWIEQGGWVGIRTPDGVIVVDIDNEHEAKLALDFLVAHGLRFNAMKTPHGMQFFFADPGTITKQDTKLLTYGGFVVDYRLPGKGQSVMPSANTPGRYWERTEDGPLSLLRIELGRLFKPKKNPATGQIERPFELPIVEGDRNTTLFQHGCRLRGFGMTETDIRLILDTLSKHFCISKSGKKDPLPDSELNSIIASVMTYEAGTRSAGAESKAEKQSHVSMLISLAAEASIFATPECKSYATFPFRGHWETWPVEHKKFKAWLNGKFVEQEGKAPKAQALNDAIGQLDLTALNSGAIRDVHLRVAEYDGKVYVDLANDNWEVVEIGPDGWSILTTSPVAFRRTTGMLPLPTPVPGGSVDELCRFVNVSDDDRPLFITWLAYSFNPNGPYPILVFQGTHGSAKSTHSRIARSLLCPSSVPLRSIPKDERDLMIAANNSLVVALDNLSGIQTWLSDALCRLSTGGGNSTRKLYTDDEEALFNVQRPIIINGIDELTTRADLADRSLIIELPTIPESERKTEKDLWSQFNQVAPRILGALFSGFSTAMNNSPETPYVPRMADFFRWSLAAESGLGLAEGAFAEAFNRNQRRAVDVSVENDPVATVVRHWVVDQYRAFGKKEWRVRLAELHADLQVPA